MFAWVLCIQVCVQVPTSAVNVALPTFAAAARASPQSINTATHQAHSTCMLLQLANGTDRRMDTVPLNRPCSAYYVVGADAGLDAFLSFNQQHQSTEGTQSSDANQKKSPTFIDLPASEGRAATPFVSAFSC